jgi:DNA-binding HxlR family transcriptional regulator
MKEMFSEEQKKIAKHLMSGPKTVEELSSLTFLIPSKITDELKKMMKLKLVEKEEGFPTKYKIKKSILEEVQKRKEIMEQDKFKIRVKAIIEVQAIEKELLKKQLDKIEEALKKEQNFTVYAAEKAEIIQEGEHFSSYLEVDLTVKDFSSLVRLMFFYGPTSVEVLRPEKIELGLDDLQDGLLEISSMVQAYTEFIAKRLNQEELAEFNKKLFG